MRAGCAREAGLRRRGQVTQEVPEVTLLIQCMECYAVTHSNHPWGAAIFSPIAIIHKCKQNLYDVLSIHSIPPLMLYPKATIVFRAAVLMCSIIHNHNGLLK